MIGHHAKVYRATDADVAMLAQNMRAEDRREMIQWTGQDALWAAQISVRGSDVAYAGYAEDGALLCIFGAKRDNLMEHTAILWELSTEAVKTHKLTFLKNSKWIFERICREMSDVEQFHNYVSLEYRGAVKWIEYLGGSLGVNRRRGLCGGEFAEFWIFNEFYNRDKEEI